MHHLTNRQLIALAIVVAVILILLGLFGVGLESSSQGQGSVSVSQTIPRVAPPQPPATAADTVTAQQGQDFQLLISYVDSGFEPQTANINVGDTVRFTDNSMQPLWIASVGSASQPPYPGISSCGGSAFDSCGPLQPGDSFQFTFTQSGTWEYMDNLDKSNIASITVH